MNPILELLLDHLKHHPNYNGHRSFHVPEKALINNHYILFVHPLNNHLIQFYPAITAINETHKDGFFDLNDPDLFTKLDVFFTELTKQP